MNALDVELTAEQIAAFDLDHNGKITINEVRKIYREVLSEETIE